MRVRVCGCGAYTVRMPYVRTYTCTCECIIEYTTPTTRLPSFPSQGGGKFIPEVDGDVSSDRGHVSHFSPSPDAVSYNSDITTSSRSVEFDTVSLNSAELPLSYEDGECVCV